MADPRKSTPLNVLFFGTPDFAEIALSALLKNTAVRVCAVVTQPDKPAGRDRELRSSPVKLTADRHGIPVLQPTRIKRDIPGFLDSLKDYAPIDLAVVAAFGQILPAEILSFPKQGCINIHGSLLPRWRGAAPIQRAIMAGDTKTGVCLMAMEIGLDTGAVFCQTEIPITPQDTAGTIHDKLAQAGAELLNTHITAIAHGELIPTAQPEIGVTYADKISNEEALLDWRRSSTELERKIRGLNPFPGAYTVFNGARLKIYLARDLPGHSSGHQPGTIYQPNPTDIYVACGSGTLAIQELQLEGRKRLTAEQFTRGVKIEVSLLS